MKSRSIAVVLSVALVSAIGSVGVARTPAPRRDTTRVGDFSFAAPKGWRLRPVTQRDHLYLDDPKHAYILEPMGRSNPQCPIVLRKESVLTPATAQSLKAVGMRSGVVDAREDEVRRSELRSFSGIRIWKADFSTSRSLLPIHTILYSFRGSDGRVYTLSCWVPPGRDKEFEKLLEELATSISA